uniref:Asparagine--tRNA ligase n=1 Tax=Arsenophonus endosymbiont of Trialeurodes vaporariorum TaxID=235567 RepID=A0A3B0MD29_9GAMM
MLLQRPFHLVIPILNLLFLLVSYARTGNIRPSPIGTNFKLLNIKREYFMNIAPVVEVLQGRVAVGAEVTVRGWVRTRRDSKAGFSFLAVYDGSCFNPLQAIVNNELDNYETEVLHLTTSCSVEVTGIVKSSEGQGQNFELSAIQVVVVGMVENPDSYPMAAKRHSVEYLREVAHLRPRTNLIGAVARVRNTLAQAIHRFFHEEGYLWVSTPIITASDTEGAGEMFRVSTLDLQNIPRTKKGDINFDKDFFGREAFLTVSGQLNGEAYACALSKIYTFGPTFRAENSNTSRHLAEFWMVEPEVAFANLDDIASLAEKMLKYVFKAVLQKRNDDLTFFAERIDKDVINRLEKFVASDFAQVDYSYAIKVLEQSGQSFENPVAWGIDLSSEHERYLAEQHFKAPVVVKNYPKDIKAFYMRLNDDNKTVAAMDVLAPGIGEIIGGSQREERLNKLDAQIKEMGLNQQDYSWYRDLRRYGTVPHAGFGLGFERLVAYVTGVQNIRETIPFPRTPRNASF